MRQLDIKFFWPLSEQIPLDLDYYECEKPKHYFSHPLSGTFLISNGSTNSFINTGKLSVDIGSTVFKVESKPNILRRGLYKALGVKWEKK